MKNDDELITLGVYENQVEAEMIENALKKNDIQVYVADTMTSMIDPVYGNVIGNIKINIQKRDHREAKRILDDYGYTYIEPREDTMDYKKYIKIAIPVIAIIGVVLSVVLYRDMKASDLPRKQRVLEKELIKLENISDIGSDKYVTVAGKLIDIHKKDTDPYALSNFYYERCEALKKFGKDTTALYAEYFLENLKDRVAKNAEANCDCKEMNRAMDILKKDDAKSYAGYQRFFGGRKLNCEE